MTADPATTARNEKIASLSGELKAMLPEVIRLTEATSEHSLHAYLTTRKAQYIDLKHTVIPSAQHYISLFLDALKADLENEKPTTSYCKFYKKLLASNLCRKYLYLFHERTFYREYENLIKKRPHVDEAEVWIGQNHANYGLLISPVFSNGTWKNDKSEIRRFRKRYWSIGHVLNTGLLIPDKEKRIIFKSVDEYLTFFEEVLVRHTGSKYQKEIAALYSNYVRSSSSPESISLLIPELRYAGVSTKHVYRLDFAIIDVESNNKIGFELSPWSSHGVLTGTKGKKQTEINAEAAANFEREMKKHKDYFREFDIFCLIYTDTDLQDINTVFNDMKMYLEPQQAADHLQLHLLAEFLGEP